MTPVNLSKFSNKWYKPGNVGKTDSSISIEKVIEEFLKIKYL